MSSFARLKGDQAQQVHRAGVARMDLEHPTVHQLGLLQPPGAMMFQTGLKCLGNAGHDRPVERILGRRRHWRAVNLPAKVRGEVGSRQARPLPNPLVYRFGVNFARTTAATCGDRRFPGFA